jgi:hypothetical protein
MIFGAALHLAALFFTSDHQENYMLATQPKMVQDWTCESLACGHIMLYKS